MTNKKLKLAAMSVALTACVAAQPMAAHAVEGPDADADDTVTPQAAPADEDAASSTTPDATDGEEEKQEEIRNEKADNAVDTIGGDDITVDYDHSKDNVTENEDGSTTTDSTGTVNRDTSKSPAPEEKGETGDPSTDNVQGSTDDGATTPDDKDAPDKDDKKEIGTANKSETVSSKTELVPGETTTNPDGSTTTTDTTLDTTVTGTGSASAKTDETFTEDVKDSLNDELGGESEKLNWKTEPGTEIGGYKVDGAVEEDGNKTFTLTKKDEESLTGPMTGEDIAKLIEADYKDNGDGTYTLTKEYVDAKGQTHTTTITVDSSTATKTTKTTLTIKMASQEHKDEKKEEFKEDYKYPSENITVKDDAGKDHTFNLKDIMDKADADKDGTFTYEDTANNLTYTITRKDDSEKYNSLDNEELADLLNKNAGGVKYTAKDGKLYYITDSGEECLVKDEDNQLLRYSLTIDITITDHHGKESDTKVDGYENEDQAKADAAQKAKYEALKKALAAAIKEETGEEISADDINLDDAKNGEFKYEWTNPKNNQTYTYTFNYNVDDNTVSSSTGTTIDGAFSAEKKTEEATAEVTGSTVIWTEKGVTRVDDSIKNTFSEGFDFKQAPTGATNAEYYTEGAYKGMLKSYIDADGKRYNFTYEAGTAPDAPAGSTIVSADFTRVSWTVKENVYEGKTDTDTGPVTDIKIQQNWNMAKEEGKDSFTFTVGNKTYKGLKPVDGKQDVYTNADGTVITIVSRTLTLPEIEAQIKNRFTGAENVTVKDNGTASYTINGVTYNVTYRSTVETATVKEQVKGSTTTIAASSTDNDKARAELEAKIKALQDGLQPGEYLEVNGHKVEKTTEVETVISYFETAINYKDLETADLIAMLKKQKADADEANKSYTGTGVEHDWWGDHKTTNNPNYIGHLDLATDSDLLLKDGTSADAILLNGSNKNFTLEWNTSADDLVANRGNHSAQFADNITLDPGKMLDGSGSGDLAHYEYNRRYTGDWIAPDSNDYPHESAYYRLTGTIAYGSLENGKEYGTKSEAEAALKKWAENNADDNYKPNIVALQKKDEHGRTHTVYKAYTYESSLTAYGYMSKDSNTCVNSGYGNATDGSSWWAGGFDLRISGLTQVTQTEVTAHGKNYYNYSANITKVSSKTSDPLTNSSLTVKPGTKTYKELVEKEVGEGNGQFGSYDLTHTQNKTYEIQEKGTSSYTTYTTWENTTATWHDVLNKITGLFKFNYTSTDDAEVTEATKRTDVHTESSVGYHYSYVESSEPIVVPPVDPDTPDNPVQDETPDEVVTPETPELPPVQDATPDEVVLPADPELPAVQDATALPQTGVNWFTALGMAFSGMLLMIAGAFTSLKYKEKH